MMPSLFLCEIESTIILSLITFLYIGRGVNLAKKVAGIRESRRKDKVEGIKQRKRQGP